MKTRNLISLIIITADSVRALVATGKAIGRTVKGKPKNAPPAE